MLHKIEIHAKNVMIGNKQIDLGWVYYEGLAPIWSPNEFNGKEEVKGSENYVTVLIAKLNGHIFGKFTSGEMSIMGSRIRGCAEHNLLQTIELCKREINADQYLRQYLGAVHASAAPCHLLAIEINRGPCENCSNEFAAFLRANADYVLRLEIPAMCNRGQKYEYYAGEFQSACGSFISTGRMQVKVTPPSDPDGELWVSFEGIGKIRLRKYQWVKIGEGRRERRETRDIIQSLRNGTGEEISFLYNCMELHPAFACGIGHGRWQGQEGYLPHVSQALNWATIRPGTSTDYHPHHYAGGLKPGWVPTQPPPPQQSPPHQVVVVQRPPVPENTTASPPPPARAQPTTGTRPDGGTQKVVVVQPRRPVFGPPPVNKSPAPPSGFNLHADPPPRDNDRKTTDETPDGEGPSPKRQRMAPQENGHK